MQKDTNQVRVWTLYQNYWAQDQKSHSINCFKVLMNHWIKATNICKDSSEQILGYKKTSNKGLIGWLFIILKSKNFKAILIFIFLRDKPDKLFIKFTLLMLFYIEKIKNWHRYTL